ARFAEVDFHRAGVPPPAEREREPRAVGQLEDAKREHREVDVPVDAADVVARAGGLDVVDLLLRGRRRREKKPRQALFAVADRLAVDVEHVAELQPAVAGRRAHEQHVRSERARLPLALEREAAQIDAVRLAADVLAVGLLGDDADEVARVDGDVVDDFVEELVELRRLCGGRGADGDRRHSRNEDGAHPEWMILLESPAKQGRPMSLLSSARVWLAVGAVAAGAAGSLVAAERSSATMASAASKFLAGLTPEQRAKAA